MISAGVSYIDEGAGEPLVLLMGLGAPASAWAPHSRVWSGRYRCISVDNRGAGDTPLGDEPVTTQLLAGDVARLIDSLGIASCSVVGISMGACIAQQLVVERPDLVRKVVLVAPWARCDSSTTRALDVMLRVRRSGDSRAFNEFLRNLIWTPEWTNEHSLEMEADLGLPPAMSLEAFEQQVRACQQHDSLDRLSEILAPTLVTWGSADIFIRPSLSLEVASKIAGAETAIFSTSGHVHHWEDLERFNALVEEWLN